MVEKAVSATILGCIRPYPALQNVSGYGREGLAAVKDLSPGSTAQRAILFHHGNGKMKEHILPGYARPCIVGETRNSLLEGMGSECGEGHSTRHNHWPKAQMVQGTPEGSSMYIEGSGWCVVHSVQDGLDPSFKMKGQKRRSSLVIYRHHSSD
jgi:hypothetical protein